MPNILDKSTFASSQRQYALQVKRGDVGKYVLLPGDPDRVARIGKYLAEAREIAFNREFRTWTGTYKGITVSATSTGVGCPSASAPPTGARLRRGVSWCSKGESPKEWARVGWPHREA